MNTRKTEATTMRINKDILKKISIISIKKDISRKELVEKILLEYIKENDI